MANEGHLPFISVHIDQLIQVKLPTGNTVPVGEFKRKKDNVLSDLISECFTDKEDLFTPKRDSCLNNYLIFIFLNINLCQILTGNKA